MFASKLTIILCTALLAVLLPAIAWGEFLGEYDHGDTVTLRAVVNDNGTAADSVSGDSIAAYVFWQTNPTDSVSLTVAGTGHPWVSAFTADFIVDTADGGFGSWYAVLYAVNVGAGTRDPVGLNSWTVFSRPGDLTTIATTTAAYAKDSVWADGRTLDDSAYHAIATASSESVWVNGKTLDDSAYIDIAGLVMDSLHKHNTPAYHIGQYQQDDSLEIYGRFAGVDSVYAYTYWKDVAQDTVELAASGFGYTVTLEADTTGAGWGSWHADIKAFDNADGDQYAVVTWDMFDRHLYAQEVGESCDVYVHDPDDSTIALVIRDSLNAWADSFYADSCYSRDDTMYVNIAQMPVFADAAAESVWTGDSYAQVLDDSVYQTIAESSAAWYSATDTIAYVTKVGLVDSVVATKFVHDVDSLRKCLTVDSTGEVKFADTLRVGGSVAVVARADSVVSTRFVHDVDSTRVVRDVWDVDSARTVGHTDSVGLLKFCDTLRAAYNLEGVELCDLTTKTTTVDSAGILTFCDTLRAAYNLEGVELCDLTTKTTTCDSAGIVTFADSLRILHNALGVDLCDSTIGVKNVDFCDTARALGAVTYLDSGRTIWHTDSTGECTVLDSGRVVATSNFSDSVRVCRSTLINDSTVATKFVHDLDSARVLSKVWDADSLRKVATCDSAGELKYCDTLKASHRVAVAALVDTARVVATANRAILCDSTIGVNRLAFADTVRVFGRGDRVTQCDTTIVVGLLDSGRVMHALTTTPTIDSVRAVGKCEDVDSVRVALLTHTATLVDTVTKVATVDLTTLTTTATNVDTVRAVGSAGVDSALISNAVWNADTASTNPGSHGWLADQTYDDADAAADSLGTIAMSQVFVAGDSIPFPNSSMYASAAATADSTLFGELWDTTYVSPTFGWFIGRLHPESTLTGAEFAAMAADSTMVDLIASAVADTLDSIAVRLGSTGDSTLCELAEKIRTSQNVVTFDADDASMVAESILVQVIDTMHNANGVPVADTSVYASGSMAALIWDGGWGASRQNMSVIDSSTVDTGGNTLGAFRYGGNPIDGTQIYAYTYADSGWSQAIGMDVDLSSDGRYYVPVYVPANGDTVLYRVRFHAPGYMDDEKIVRFPQP